MANSARAKKILEIALPLVGLTILGVVLQGTIVSQPDKVSHWLASFGPFLYLIYAIIQSIGIIFPPFPGSIFQVALIAILGPAKALLFGYFLLTPLYCVNFLLAKKYGRPFVEKFLGKNSMGKIDHYSKDAGVGTLILLKIFMGNLFDYLAYGIGLTNVSFKNFFWVNLIAGIPAIVVQYYIFTYSKDFISSLLFVGLVGMAFSGSYVFFHHLKHRKSS